MPEYIDRETIIKTIKENPFTMSMGCLTVDECNGMNRARKLLAELFKTLPAIDAVPVVHGEWFEQDNPGQFDFRDTWVRCSNCNYLTTAVWSHSHKYCPNCGAKMDGGADNG